MSFLILVLSLNDVCMFPINTKITKQILYVIFTVGGINGDEYLNNKSILAKFSVIFIQNSNGNNLANVFVIGIKGLLVVY